MEIKKLTLPGAFVYYPKKFEDSRGYFLESFNEKRFEEILGYKFHFVQDNHSFSYKNVLRGLHFQKPPYAQDKLVRVIGGRVLDVIVDIRHGSPTYGKFEYIELSEKNGAVLFVPKGFAHGFVTLSESVHFLYKVSDYYHPENDCGIRWNDPDLNIPWPVDNPILSEKDSKLPLLKDLDKYFKYEN